MDRPLYRWPIFSLHNQFINNKKANSDKCDNFKNKVITSKEYKKNEFSLLIQNFYNFYTDKLSEGSNCLERTSEFNTNTNTYTNTYTNTNSYKNTNTNASNSSRIVRRRSKLRKRISGIKKSLTGEDVRSDLSIINAIISMCQYFPVCIEFDSTYKCHLGHIAKSKLNILTVVENVIEYYYGLKKEGNNLFPLILTPDFK